MDKVNNMTITTDNKRIELVKRLLEAKAISFEEAVELLKIETKIEYKYTPNYGHNTRGLENVVFRGNTLSSTTTKEYSSKVEPSFPDWMKNLQETLR